MSKVYFYVIGVLLALVLVTSAGLYSSVRANSTLRSERNAAVDSLSRTEKELKRVEGTLALTRAEKATQARKFAQDSSALKKAQEASPEWSGGVVPLAVQEALSGALTP